MHTVEKKQKRLLSPKQERQLESRIQISQSASRQVSHEHFLPTRDYCFGVSWNVATSRPKALVTLRAVPLKLSSSINLNNAACISSILKNTRIAFARFCRGWEGRKNRSSSQNQKLFFLHKWHQQIHKNNSCGDIPLVSERLEMTWMFCSVQETWQEMMWTLRMSLFRVPKGTPRIVQI